MPSPCPCTDVRVLAAPFERGRAYGGMWVTMVSGVGPTQARTSAAASLVGTPHAARASHARHAAADVLRRDTTGFLSGQAVLAGCGCDDNIIGKMR